MCVCVHTNTVAFSVQRSGEGKEIDLPFIPSSTQHIQCTLCTRLSPISPPPPYINLRDFVSLSSSSSFFLASPTYLFWKGNGGEPIREELSRYNYSASHWCSGYWIAPCQVKPLLSLIKDRNDNKFVMLKGLGFITSRGNLMNFLLEERLGNHLNPRMVGVVPWRPTAFTRFGLQNQRVLFIFQLRKNSAKATGGWVDDGFFPLQKTTTTTTVPFSREEAKEQLVPLMSFL